MRLMPVLGAAAALVLANPALAQVKGPVSAASPGGTVSVEFGTDGDGRALYTVSRKGKPIIAPSRLGFLFTDVAKIDRRLEITGTETRDFDQTWNQPWGEWSSIRNRYRELKVHLRETTALARVFTVTFRLYDDGVGFRYEFPQQPNMAKTKIADELTEFAFAQDGTAWWKPAYLWNREEYLYDKTKLSSVSTAATPVTIKLADGTHVALHEAALIDFAGMNVTRTEGTTLRANLTPGAGRPKVEKTGAWNTPWRTLIIADDAPGIYMSHLMLNLNEPNKLGDMSWFKPGKFAGVWWNMIKGEWSWARGAKHGATNANVMRYIDFAAANGIPNVLVEGWNVGWDGDWFGNGWDMDFTKPTEDFDITMLSAYARKKGVRLVGHHETGGAVTHYDNQMDRSFAFAAKYGMMVVKTGYVTDAAQLERVDPDGTKYREWLEGQWMTNHFVRVAETAYKYRVAFDSHEPVKGTGLHRTYPNWVAREGMRGMEYNAWGGKNPPEHEANIVFTRMLEGPMDFTPGVLSLKGEKDSNILSTIAKQLALYVVIYSPVQMVADTPENYAKYPGPMKFIRDVPTDWDETRVLNGEVGDYVTIVRKQRGAEDWYLGAVGDEEARTVSFKLDFLNPGSKYVAEIYRDGDDADYRTDKRHAIVIEQRSVSAADSMTLRLAPGGGAAVRFRRVK
ncbi:MULTISPECIES: glycoside hydrolase family 97 protein [unclassified Novosphingobium]|uniref:glycoside hydrolase family 97 protein n=1 Tax=unclassified Novosphingobium TaxID=2644732 RepID=UPI000EC897EA|nr:MULTISPECIES: glycoside hydrolase family 97 protein [unclassified Novosphingobium]HCF25490.1 alpha-glucosidase [Novosphingobium sp.]HQV03207.1 glycoside hydrolase family 97 protein [Novosphingobium sp.]